MSAFVFGFSLDSRFLSGYAIWAGRRWRRPGHLFQGRYRAEMIEDESYYWTVSRYIHLNPVRAGLVQRPEQWEWSSYPGYRDARRAQAWVAHDELLAAWQGGFAVSSFVFVFGGLTRAPSDDFGMRDCGTIARNAALLALPSIVGGRCSEPPTVRAVRKSWPDVGGDVKLESGRER